MIAQQDGVGSIKNMGLQKMDTTRFFKSKEELALYVNDTLTRSDPEEILQSIMITRLERLGERYAIGVTMYCSVGS